MGGVEFNVYWYIPVLFLGLEIHISASDSDVMAVAESSLIPEFWLTFSSVPSSANFTHYFWHSPIFI